MAKKTAIKSKNLSPKVFREGIDALYPENMVHLHYDKQRPWTMLFAVILSAQCTDARVNMVTPVLFRTFPTLTEMAKASVDEIRQQIASVSFPNNKAKHLQGSAQRLLTEFGGKVPEKMADLITLPGVGRKTANVVAHVIYGHNLGFVVDTHIGRIAKRTGQTKNRKTLDPIKIEKDMMKAHPQETWGNLAHKMVQFGRDVCPARKPKCEICPFNDLCPKKGVQPLK